MYREKLTAQALVLQLLSTILLLDLTSIMIAT